jgi:hypothetical protein
MISLLLLNYSAIFCVCCGALAAGLTVGLLSLDALKLKIRLVTGTKAEKVNIIDSDIEDYHYLYQSLSLSSSS